MAEPMYRQIADDLRRKIETGELPKDDDDTLPTEIELMEQYDASRNTVRDAIKLLASRGLVETRPGQGTFVVEKINPFVTTLSEDPHKGRGGGEQGVYIAEVEAGGRTPSWSEPEVGIKKATGVVAIALRIQQGEQVVSRYQERYIDGTPWSRQTSYYPMSLVDRGARALLDATDIKEGAVAYLARHPFNIKQVGYSDSIEVRQADDDETKFFRLPPDGRVPVFEVFRVAFDENGNRIRMTVTVYPCDRNRLVANFGKIPRAAITGQPQEQDTQTPAG